MKNRTKHLNSLKKYIKRCEFPTNKTHPYNIPIFVDDKDIHCAVGYILKEDNQFDIINNLQQNFNYNYIEDMNLDPIKSWLENSGLGLDELKLIQPSYDGWCESMGEYLDDCSGDGDCCPSAWVGDGWCDGEDQLYGCDLSCYADSSGTPCLEDSCADGGDCGWGNPCADAPDGSEYVEDCSGDGDCAPAAWVGDGWCDDGEPYGYDLTCWDLDENGEIVGGIGATWGNGGDGGDCNEADYSLGDMNQDGLVDVLDIVIAVDLILNGNYDVVADINEDGQLNVLDIVMLVDWVLNGMPEADSDGDGVLDDDDSDPNNPYQCSDVDGDACEDCSTGTFNPSDDGFDYDGDGQCDAGDDDDDNDGCLDVDDDASLEWDDDYDADGTPDDCDSDDDNDGAAYPADSDDNNEFECSDDDDDSCDDCSSGSYNTSCDCDDDWEYCY